MSGPAKWIPADDELDGLARTIPAAEPRAERIEDARTAVLASAGGRRQLPARSSTPIFVIGGVALAAAAAMIIWLVARSPESPARKENIAAIGVAKFQTLSGWPSYTVQLEEGQIAVEVAALDPSEHFVVRASDAEVEVRGTKFVVGAAGGKLAMIRVSDGSVELRRPNESVVILAAGQTWNPPITAIRDELLAKPRPVPIATPPPKPVVDELGPESEPVVVATTAKKSSPDPVRPTASKQPATAVSNSKATMTAVSPTAEGQAPVITAKPGELDFKNGVAALRAGDAEGATRSFTAACSAARGNALDEDACFWVGAAARRAHQTATARIALASFLQRFPGSARAGEAAALLGWILYDAGELDTAETRFRLAAGDRVPQVKESAERGLAAIERKRAK